MAKNSLKMLEIFWGASHMIDINILTFFVFKFLVFGLFLDLIFRAIFSKFGQNTGFVKYPKTNNSKTKNFEMGIRVATGTERAPNIEQVIAAWPRPGQARPQPSASHLHICII